MKEWPASGQAVKDRPHMLCYGVWLPLIDAMWSQRGFYAVETYYIYASASSWRIKW